MLSESKLIVPTDEEDVAINRGIAADPDTFEVSEEKMRTMQPLASRGRPKFPCPSDDEEHQQR